MKYPDFKKCTILTDTATYCTDGVTTTPQLGMYSKNTVIISTPKSREQNKIYELNKQLIDLLK